MRGKVIYLKSKILKIAFGVYVTLAIILTVILVTSFITWIDYNFSAPEKAYNEIVNNKLEHPYKVKKIFKVGGIDPTSLFIWYYKEEQIDEMIKQDFWQTMDEDQVKIILNEKFLKWFDKDLDKEYLEKYEKSVKDDVFKNSKNLFAFLELNDQNYGILILDVDRNVIYEFFVNL